MYTKHILAEFDEQQQIQRCVICGEIIHNYQGAVFASTDENTSSKLGWNPGEHYVSDGNPKIFTSYLQEDEKFINCNNK